MSFIVERRPFAIEPLTGIMLPDGIFDASLPRQDIGCHLTNAGTGAVTSLTVWIKAVSDAGILIEQHLRVFTGIAPGASVLATWPASFVAASPGKVTVTIAHCYWVEAQITTGTTSGPGALFVGSLATPLLIETTVFVTRTTFDQASQQYICEVPEGRLRVALTGIVGPHTLRRWRRPQFARKNVFVGPVLVRRAELVMEPATPYAGVHGDLPFHDPWWKVVAWVVFVVALVAAIVAAVLGYGTAYIGMKGEDFVNLETGDPDCYNCSVDTWGGPEALSVAGVLSIVAMLALAVGLADDADPWRRGQQATPPEPGELTSRESVRFTFDYHEPLAAGRPFAVGVEWEYTRQTQTRNRKHAVREERRNTHLAKKRTFEVTPPVSSGTEPVDVTAKFVRPDGTAFIGADLYVYALITAPGGRSARVILEDSAAGGVYRGRFVPAQLAAGWSQKRDQVKGTWQVFVCAQDTNAAPAGQSPEVMAQYLGGYMVHAPFPIAVDGSRPCPDQPDATFTVA